MYLLLFIIIFVIDVDLKGECSLHTSNYDTYGVKISGNDIMLIEALHDSQVFLIRFAASNSTPESIECPIMYNNSNQYVYSVGIGKKQNLNQTYFFYAGEIVSKKSLSMVSSNTGHTFIGILNNKGSQISEDTENLLNCNYFQYESVEFVSSYDHQEFFVFGVEPYGQYAIGLAKDFVFIYHPFSDPMLITKNSNNVWPTNTIFLPVAIDIDISYTIVAGFVINGPLFRVRATPTVYIISNSNLTILLTWSYTAAIHSWQSRLTYANLKEWSDKYIMSVSINSEDPSRILVGMPFINTVFLLIINLNDNSLILDSFIDNGDSIGFGKSVAWLSNSQAAILSSNDLSNNSSTIYLYKSLNKTSLPSLPSYIYPNIQQSLPTIIDTHFIQMISTPNSLAILIISSEVLLIIPSLPGYFSSTSLSSTTSEFITSESKICMAGTYKTENSIFPCNLCPSGSRNSGNIRSILCINCSINSFCPIGSVDDINNSYLYSRSQAHVHPRSPEVTVFDEILLQNMFSTGANDHCIIFSPLFWVSIVISIVLIILTCMGILKRYVKHPKSEQVRHHVKKIFRQTDLIVSIIIFYLNILFYLSN